MVSPGHTGWSWRSGQLCSKSARMQESEPIRTIQTEAWGCSSTRTTSVIFSRFLKWSGRVWKFKLSYTCKNAAHNVGRSCSSCTFKHNRVEDTAVLASGNKCCSRFIRRTAALLLLPQHLNIIPSTSGTFSFKLMVCLCSTALLIDDFMWRRVNRSLDGPPLQVSFFTNDDGDLTQARPSRHQIMTHFNSCVIHVIKPNSTFSEEKRKRCFHLISSYRQASLLSEELCIYWTFSTHNTAQMLFMQLVTKNVTLLTYGLSFICLHNTSLHTGGPSENKTW